MSRPGPLWPQFLSLEYVFQHDGPRDFFFVSFLISGICAHLLYGAGQKEGRKTQIWQEKDDKCVKWKKNMKKEQNVWNKKERYFFWATKIVHKSRRTNQIKCASSLRMQPSRKQEKRTSLTATDWASFCWNIDSFFGLQICIFEGHSSRWLLKFPEIVGSPQTNL